MRTRFLLFFFIGYIISSCLGSKKPLLAQGFTVDPATAGRHFVIAFPDIGDGAENLFRPTDQPAFAPFLYLYLYSPVPNTATVISPAGGIRRIDLTEGIFERISITEINGGITGRTGEVIGSGITVRTIHPVVAYCYIETTSGADAWTPMPVENWGAEYSAFTFPGQVLIEAKRESRGFVTGSSPVPAPAGIMIVAAYDNTRVSIIPPVPLEGRPPLAVTLNAGEIYQVQSVVDTSAEKRTERQQSLHGTRISSTRPVGVLSGNTRFNPLDDVHSASDNTLKNLFYEWLAPTDMLGTEFVYTPTWDPRRQLGQQGEDYGKKRAGESLFISGTAPGTTEGVYRDIYTGGDEHFTVEEGELHKQYMAGQARPGYLRTSQPARVLVAPSPVAIKTEATGEAIGAEYETYGSYVAEAVPTEQWPNVAPFFIPATALTTEHYLNVVTRKAWEDSIVLWTQGGAEQSFLFNRGEIPETDYVWGTVALIPGKTYYLRGLGEARFSGTVYGFADGYEAHGIASYNPEYIIYQQKPGIAYGYALSPRRNVTGPPDSLVVETGRECITMNVSVRVVSADPAGLRSAELAPGAVNTRIRFITPAGGELSGLLETEFVVEPVDRDSNASATVLITDRTGAQTSIPFTYKADRFIVTNPWMGTPLPYRVSVGIDTAGYSIRAVNEGEDTVIVQGVELAEGSHFIIARFAPPLPAAIPPRGEVTVSVIYPFADSASTHLDTLRFVYDCGRVRTVPLEGETIVPCVELHDIDFGTLKPGESRTLPLTITNTGEGHIYFRNNGENPVLGLGDGFSTSPTPFNGLDSYRLPKGYSMPIDVTFTATEEGEFRRVLRFASNWRGCRDSSILTARVRREEDTTTTGVDRREERSGGNGIVRVAPNPFGSGTAITINIAERNAVRLEITDLTGARRAMLLEKEMEPGSYTVRWDPGDLPSGIYYARLAVGERNGTSRLVLIR